MTETTRRMRWSVENRLEFIEFRLYWDGWMNRSHIVDQFGVSVPQASTDLARYQELAPDNLEYDPKAKRFRATDRFVPRLLKPNAERYLAQLKAVADDVIAPLDTWIGDFPEAGVTPVPARRVDPVLLQKFLTAIRGQRSISIQYQSMNDSRPEPMWREITPHAFGSDGLRWHIRAYCHLESKFKDFIISRCLQVGNMGPARIEANKDTGWFTYFNVVLIPNPKLAPAQQRTIELDFGMTEGRTEIRVRQALLYYLDKRLRLDVAEKQDRPKETPIVVANRKDYDRALKTIVY